MANFAPNLTPSTSKKQKREYHAEDRINELPDEVLMLILSHMPMKAAARTSVLSRRWEKLWLRTSHPCLFFDGSKTLVNIQYQVCNFVSDYYRVKEVLDSERVRYINWVNHILEFQHLPAIDEFRVRFDLDEGYQGDIDEWVRFAFEKKVKRFELDLSNYQGFIHNKDFCYKLCSRTLGLQSSISLTSLILKQVNVSGEVVENLISNSPFLECLCVGGSRSLVHLRVAGPSLCLTYLEIINCASMKSLELNSPNLLSFKYSGSYIKVRFIKVPNLAELCIGGSYLEVFYQTLPLVSTFAFQLQKLVLTMGVNERKLKGLVYPILCHLKQLELKVIARDHESLLSFSSLINVCPSLNRFALELIWVKPLMKRKLKKVKSPHYNLKVVEISGFVGQRVDTEFLMYLIENAVMLEKISIDPFTSYQKGTPYEDYRTERANAARECAKQLMSKYCLEDKLVIL